MLRAMSALLVFLCLSPLLCSEKEQIANEMETFLIHHFLEKWYPLTIDSKFSGTLNTFTRDWKPVGPQDKWLVPQARHVWTASKAAARYPEDDRYRKTADAGYAFLKECLWDSEFGGFFAARDRKGRQESRSRYGDTKLLYGNAFAIYGLVAYYELTGEKKALDLAIDDFLWIEKHAYDPQYGGYFEQFNREGDVLRRGDQNYRHSPEVRTFEQKGMNASIHLLEAYTTLYKVWPDSLLKEKLSELLALIRDTITHKDGYMRIFFEPDWTPISYRDSTAAVREKNVYFDHVTFGHDVETAFLMLEASHGLGTQTDSTTLRKAKQMVDHSLQGWDEEKGGFFSAGYYFKGSTQIAIIDKRKEWWVEAEGMNALLLMSILFHEEGYYWDLFKRQWEYIKTYLIDTEFGGWYASGLDQTPHAKKGLKGYSWKTSYHDGRAMMHCIDLLRSQGSIQ